MDLEESKELPKSSVTESQTQTPPKLRTSICWCIRMEICSYVFHVYLLVGSMSFLGACYLLAIDDGPIADMLRGAGDSSDLYKIALCLSAVVVGQGILSLGLAFAVKQRIMRVLQFYVFIMAALDTAAALFATVWTLHRGDAGWFAISQAFLRRLPVFCLLVLSVLSVRMCYDLAKNPETLAIVNEVISEIAMRKTSA